jgi:hypothetical protein
MKNTACKFLTGLRCAGVGLIAFCGCGTGFAWDAIEEVLTEGTVSGNLRSHYNQREYATRADAPAYAVGGGLRVETGSMGWIKLGAGFYTVQDLGMNNEDPARVDGRMGDDLEVVGEAYLNLTVEGTSVTMGRQKIVTPFANPIDVFIVPFTYEGLSIKHTGVPNLTLELDYVTAIKSGGSDEFVDVGLWSTNRLGAVAAETDGTLMLGAVYKDEIAALHAWWYEFADLFVSRYVQADYAFAPMGVLEPFVSAQLIRQSEAGEALLGEVDSMLYGLQGGVAFGASRLTLGWNSAAEKSGAFRNGAFLAPYNFSTSPLYTNSMLQNMENVDAGEGVKLTFFHAFASMDLKISHADLNFVSAPDVGATDFDVTYRMDRGLSLRYRVEIVTSDTEAAEQSDHRFQIQYVF